MSIQSLDCTNPDKTLASCDPSLPPPKEAVTWRNALEQATVKGEDYEEALAQSLQTTVCSGGDWGISFVWSGNDAIYVLRGLISNARLHVGRPEPQSLIDTLLNKESQDCPVSASLTDADRAELLQIKQDALLQIMPRR